MTNFSEWKKKTPTNRKWAVFLVHSVIWNGSVIFSFFFCHFASLQLSVISGHLTVILSFSVYPSLHFLFSRALHVPPHICSRGLSRLLTFLWPFLYYVGTIRFILTRFTGVTLTTLLSACACLCVCLCFIDLTLLRVNDVWKQTEEFRLLKFP